LTEGAFMDIIFEKTLLYDFYGELLTKKQRGIYELYHQDDLSLAEISEQMGISRQGVHDTLKRCENQLHKFEEKLKLVEKFIRNKQKINEINQLTNIVNETSYIDKKQLIDALNGIKSMTSEILEDL
jgi:predicted DNA-binding protein YlxM (UPF0122 family)